MSLEPTTIALPLSSNAGFVRDLQIVKADRVTPQDLTGWTFRAAAKAAFTDTVAALSATVTSANPTTGIITLAIAQSAIAALFSGTSKVEVDLVWDLLAKPAGYTDPIRLAFGPVVAVQGVTAPW